MQYNGFQEKGFHLTSKIEQQFETYYSTLLEWNEKMNLTAITEESEVYEKHFLDSLLLGKYCELRGEMIDVGTGAGFPGVVIAIYSKDVHVTLLEPLQKRCTFLKELTDRLQLDNVTIVNQRSEDYAKEKREMFDIVTARAVAPLPILNELCIPLVKIGGKFISMKGTKGIEEAGKTKIISRKMGCKEVNIQEDILPSGEKRTFLIYEKEKPTPKQYPRAYAQIKKKPLED